MSSRFHKFKNKITLTWDVDKIVDGITMTLSNSVDSYEVLVVDSKEPYWQLYKATNTIFARNFNAIFPSLAKEVIDQLKILQSQARPEDFADLIFYNAFIDHKFDFKKITLIKSLPGIDVKPHIDNGRFLAINIGLKNSNTCTTYISDSSAKNGFWEGDLHSYTLEDNEVCIVNVDLTHAVKSNVTADSDQIRYLITYHIR
jgi:hypothetical protein